MNAKFTQIKKNIKHHTPEILVGLSVTTAVVVYAYTKGSGRLLLNVPKESLEALREGEVLIYSIKGHNYSLQHFPF